MEQQLLIRRAQRGDRSAFAELVAQHREAIYRAAYAVLQDPEEALDAAQEASLRAYRGIGRFEGRASFRTWARRIATHVAIDRRSRRQRDRRFAGALPDGDALPDGGADSAPERLARAERRRLVREAIDTLPPAQRAAVLLRDVEGLAYQEIADTLGIPKGTVMSRIYYGRATLKERLAPTFGPRAEALRAARGQEGAA